ncbi:hypothetical protein ABZ464_27740 [Streptomyces sp. NPDC005820]|uniref:RNA polymerase sigma factor n=1 Tax=Streptomyces sp. NPDC005820 TaxID=3157069 RepID=UPI00340FACB7
MRRRRTAAGDYGDPAGHRALEGLYTAHADRELAYLLHRTDRETAQDILSETFVPAWRKSGSVPDDALPWLLASARRLRADLPVTGKADGRGAQGVVHSVIGALRRRGPPPLPPALREPAPPPHRTSTPSSAPARGSRAASS